MALEFTLSYFTSILISLFVYVLLFAALAKTKILGENKFVLAVVSLIIALLLLSTPAARGYVVTVAPWATVLVVLVFFVLLLTGFTGNLDYVKKPGFVIALVVLVVVIFLIAGMPIFSELFSNASKFGATPASSGIRNLLFQPEVLGMIILFVVAAVVAWVINK